MPLRASPDRTWKENGDDELVQIRDFFLGVLFAASASAAPGSVQQQIQSLADDMAHAANAHGTERYMGLFAHDPSLVFAINGRVIHGWDALRAQQLKWWRNGKSDVVYTQSGATELLPLDADAVVTTQTLSSRRTGPDGEISTGSFVVTSVWKKLPQGWRIVYGRESWTR